MNKAALEALGRLGDHAYTSPYQETRDLETIAQALRGEGECPRGEDCDLTIAYMCGQSREAYRHKKRGAAVDVESLKRDIRKYMSANHLAEPPIEWVVEHLHNAGHLRGGWRDIESAPRDGTHVLCYFPQYKGEVPIELGSKTTEVWYENDDWCDGECSYEDWLPTGWQPLPPAPHDTGGDDNGS